MVWRRAAAAAILRTPSGEPSEALRIAATGGTEASALSVRPNPIASRPALWAIPSASSAAFSSCRSSSAARPACGANLALQAARKHVALDRLVDSLARRRDPDAAAGEPALDVGNDRAIRPGHEPDQFIDRLDISGERAQPLGAAPAFTRSRGRYPLCRRAPASGPYRPCPFTARARLRQPALLRLRVARDRLR